MLSEVSLHRFFETAPAHRTALTDDEEKQAILSNYLLFSADAEPLSTAYFVLRRSELRREIDSFRLLADDWDGEGAARPSSEAINFALQFITFVPDGLAVPEAYPNPSGTISFHWRWMKGRAELELGRTRHSWLVADRSLPGSARVSCSGSNSVLSRSLIELLQLLISVCAAVESHSVSTVEMKHKWYPMSLSL